MIHTVPPLLYIGKGTDSPQKMHKQIEAENEGIMIPTQVR